ncbi:MAG: DUF6432 family protein [Halolamina sp.]
MALSPEHRDRDEVEAEVLAALADRAEEGMNVLELRAAVDADIDRLEPALAELKDDGLIDVESTGERVVLYPAAGVVAGPDEHETEPGMLEIIRDRFGF